MAWNRRKYNNSDCWKWPKSLDGLEESFFQLGKIFGSFPQTKEIEVMIK